MGAGALRVDPEELTLVEDPAGRRQRALGGRCARPVDRHLPGAGEELPLEPALQPGRGEVLGLGHEGHPAGERQRHEQPVGVREVVAGQDRGAFGRHVRRPLDLGPEDHAQHGTDGDPLQEPVEHRTLTSLSPAHDPERSKPRPSQRRSPPRRRLFVVGHNRGHDDRLPHGPVQRPGPARAHGWPPDRSGAQPRLHRLARLDAAVGRGPGRARVRRGAAPPARARHDLAGDERDHLGRLVRRGHPGVRQGRRRERRRGCLRAVDGRRPGAASRGRPPGPGRGRRRGEPDGDHQAQGRARAPGAQVAGPFLPRHHQRHQEAGGRGARLHPDPAQGGPLDVPGRAGRLPATCPGSPPRSWSSIPRRTTSSTTRRFR